MIACCLIRDPWIVSSLISDHPSTLHHHQTLPTCNPNSLTPSNAVDPMPTYFIPITPTGTSLHNDPFSPSSAPQ